jgi:acyl-CoA oxidase
LENIRVAELHAATFLFDDNAARFSNAGTTSVGNIMHRLTALWGIHVLHTYSDQGIKEGFFTPAQVAGIEALYYEVIQTHIHSTTRLFSPSPIF